MHKTEILILTKCHTPGEIDTYMDGLTMRSKKLLNYVGIRIDSKLTWIGSTMLCTRHRILWVI